MRIIELILDEEDIDALKLNCFDCLSLNTFGMLLKPYL